MYNKEDNGAKELDFEDILRKGDVECLEIMKEAQRLILETEYVDGMFMSLRSSKDEADLSDIF